MGKLSIINRILEIEVEVRYLGNESSNSGKKSYVLYRVISWPCL